MHARPWASRQPTLSVLRPGIDAHFSHPTVPAILASLEAESSPEYADWPGRPRRSCAAGPPTMLSVTLRQLQRGKDMSLAACFRMELSMTQQCFEQGDFMEGVRALLIHKDKAPKWRPGRIEDVTDAMIEPFFRSRWTPAAHPLANLANS